MRRSNQIKTGRAGENTRAIEANWDRIFGSKSKPRCECGEPLKRSEVGRCAACISGVGRPDA